MSAPLLYQMPTDFVGGTTVVYTKQFGDYPSSAGWTMTLYLVGPAVLDPPAAGVSTSSGWQFTLTAAQTSALKAGRYNWQEIAQDASGNRYLSGYGVVNIHPDPRTMQAGDNQTQEEKDLAAVNAVLSGRITNDLQNYSIAGRSVTKIPHKELRELQANLQSRVNAQKYPNRFGVEVRGTFTGIHSEYWPRGWPR